MLAIASFRQHACGLKLKTYARVDVAIAVLQVAIGCCPTCLGVDLELDPTQSRTCELEPAVHVLPEVPSKWSANGSTCILDSIAFVCRSDRLALGAASSSSLAWAWLEVVAPIGRRLAVECSRFLRCVSSR